MDYCKKMKYVLIVISYKGVFEFFNKKGYETNDKEKY